MATKLFSAITLLLILSLSSSFAFAATGFNYSVSKECKAGTTINGYYCSGGGGIYNFLCNTNVTFHPDNAFSFTCGGCANMPSQRYDDDFYVRVLDSSYNLKERVIECDTRLNCPDDVYCAWSRTTHNEIIHTNGHPGGCGIDMNGYETPYLFKDGEIVEIMSKNYAMGAGHFAFRAKITDSSLNNSWFVGTNSVSCGTTKQLGHFAPSFGIFNKNGVLPVTFNISDDSKIIMTWMTSSATGYDLYACYDVDNNGVCDTACCGNGLLDEAETCDDKNLNNGDGCNSHCIDEVPGAICGNSIVEAGESCDKGAANGNCSLGCSISCTTISMCIPVNCVGSWSGCIAGNKTYSVTVPLQNGGVACPYADGAKQSCQECGNGYQEPLEQCDFGNITYGGGNGACPKVCSDVCGLNGCSEICGNLLDDDGNGLVDDGCPVHLTGYLLDGETGSVLSSPGWLMINGSRIEVISGSMFDVLLPPGAYVLTAGAAGYGINESSVGVSANPTRFNISIPSAQCKNDCSLDGRCDFDQCGSFCGVTDPDDLIYRACNGKLVGHLADLQNGSLVKCCTAIVPDSSVRTNFSISTCSTQVIPIKRIVSFNGRMYTLVVASFNDCD